MCGWGRVFWFFFVLVDQPGNLFPLVSRSAAWVASSPCLTHGATRSAKVWRKGVGGKREGRDDSGHAWQGPPMRRERDGAVQYAGGTYGFRRR